MDNLATHVVFGTCPSCRKPTLVPAFTLDPRPPRPEPTCDCAGATPPETEAPLEAPGVRGAVFDRAVVSAHRRRTQGGAPGPTAALATARHLLGEVRTALKAKDATRAYGALVEVAALARLLTAEDPLFDEASAEVAALQEADDE